MSATNRGGATRRDADFYPSPPWTVRALLHAIDLPDGVWLEPAVGGGAIVSAVEANRGPHRSARRWLACDIRPVETPAGVEASDLRIGDFLDPQTLAAMPRPDVIITNPPFSHALPFAERCLELAAGQAWTALLLRVAFLESAARAPFLRKHPPDLLPFSDRPSFTDGSSTDSAAYGWFIWPPGAPRRAGVLHPPVGKILSQASLALGAP